MPVNIDFYAGWYGIAPFLLLTRENIDPGRIRSFDIDSAATAVAQRLNRHWMISDTVFEAITADVNDLQPSLDEVDLIVNTSIEHMTRDDWFKNIPSGMMVALQGTNMIHDDENVPNPILSMLHLKKRYPLERVSSMQMDFDYAGKEPFSRYQIMGWKI